MIEAESTERAVLGAMILYPEIAEQAAHLPLKLFSLSSHRQIFGVMKLMNAKGQQIDSVTLTVALADCGSLSSVGGASYVAYLTEGIMRIKNLDGHIKILIRNQQRRELISLGNQISARASGDEEVDEIIASSDKSLLDLQADEQEDVSLEKQSHAELSRLDSQRAGSAVMGYSYGIPRLDSMVLGIVPGELTILGGRPQQGKSSLIAQIVCRHCPTGVPIHVFSYEMSAGQFLRRIWAIVSGIPFRFIRNPTRMSESESRRLREVVLEVSTWPLTIEDCYSLTAEQMCAKAKSGKRKRGTKIVMVDYLQKMRFNGQVQQRYLDVTSACVSMALLAKSEQLAVMVLSSVSEKTGKSRNDAPTLQDFRQSGDIAYEASTALLIHREIDSETEKPRQDGYIIVAKARSDQGGNCAVVFNTENLTFQEGKQ